MRSREWRPAIRNWSEAQDSMRTLAAAARLPISTYAALVRAGCAVSTRAVLVELREPAGLRPSHRARRQKRRSLRPHRLLADERQKRRSNLRVAGALVIPSSRFPPP